MSAEAEKLIVGKISGVYGVKGWVKVYSETDPREGITQYNPWYLKQRGEWQEVRIESGRCQAKTVIAKLEGCDDRDAAMLLNGAEIAIREDQLKKLAKNEYYWRDLVGLRAINTGGVNLGKVKSMMETGANDVLVIVDEDGGEHLVPWTPGRAVLEVDLEQGRLLVDWDAEF